MNTLLAGLVLFFGVHFVPSFPALRHRLQSGFGARGYKGLFSLLAAAGLALIIYGMSRASFTPVFAPPAFGGTVAGLAMPLAFCLLAAANMPNNFRRVIRHPMLTGVMLWAFVHLLANGDLASVLLFGSFALFSVVDMMVVNRRAPSQTPARQPLWRDGMVLAIGFGGFLLVRHLHGLLFGVPVVP